MSVKKDENLDAVVVTKDVALWSEVLKNAENELANTEEIYFKNMTFNRAIVELAKEKLEEAENAAKTSDA